jgi:hypothetical protein
MRLLTNGGESCSPIVRPMRAAADTRYRHVFAEGAVKRRVSGRVHGADAGLLQ